MLSDWKREEVALAWARAVERGGDIFHRFILKPYVAAAIHSFHAGEPLETANAFYGILSDALKSLPDGSDPAAAQERVEAACSERLAAINGLRVLDLGGGEGFIGRWLAPHLEQYTLLDVSLDLLQQGLKRWSDASARLQLLEADLEMVVEAPSLEAWLDSCPSVSLDPTLAASDRFAGLDVVLCTAVLDHLRSPSSLLRALAQACGRADKQPLVIVATLNPDFFLGGESGLDGLLAPLDEDKAHRVRMGPAEQDVDVRMRPWLKVEKEISEAGFSIVSCDPAPICQYPADLQEAFVRAAGLSHPPAGGPFILWTLLSARKGSPLDKEKASAALERFELLKRLSPGARQNIEASPQDVRQLAYAPGEMIAYPSNFPHGLFLVTEGEAKLFSRGREQVFGLGEAFGELETGDDPFVSRYSAPVCAGPEGCEVLRIEPPLLTTLLGEERKSLGEALYEVLRERMSTFYWVYQKVAPTHRRIRQVGDDIDDRECEAAANILLLGATLEGGNLRRRIAPPTANDGRSILVSLQVMRDVLAGERPPAGSKASAANNTPYLKVLKLFHGLGLIDCYPVSKYAQGSGRAQEHVRESRARLTAAAFQHVFFGTIRQGAPEHAQLVDKLEAQHLQELGTDGLPRLSHHRLSWDPFTRGIVRQVMERTLMLSEPTEDFVNELQRWAERALLPIDRDLVRYAALRFTYNMAFTANEFYRRSACRFFVLSDIYALRRIALGVTDWIEELQNRAGPSPHVTWKGEARNRLCAEPRSLGLEDEWRFDAYLRRFETFAQNCWTRQLDLQHTHDAFLQASGLVGDALTAARHDERRGLEAN